MQRCLDKAAEQRVTVHGPRFELRMKLAAEKPGMAAQLDNLHQRAVRRHPAQHHPFGAEFGPVVIVELVAMAVPLRNLFPAIQLGGESFVLQHTRIAAQAHGAAFGVDGFLLFHEMNHRMGRLQVEFRRVGAL